MAAKTRLDATGQRIDNATGQPYGVPSALKDLSIKLAPQTTPAISPEVLSSTEKPMVVTPPLPPTQGAGLAAGISQGTDALTQQVATEVETAAKEKETSLKNLLRQRAGVEGETTATANAYAKSVDPLAADLRDINQQILEEQVSNRRRIETLTKQGGGLEASVQAEARRLENESLSKQADLSVIQLARQGKYDSAKAIADRAVAAKLEQQQLQTDALKFAYEENKEIFTKAEQRQFELAQGDRERKLQEETAKAKQLSDTKLEALKYANLNGAPLAILTAIQSAKTAEEVISAGGEYGVTDMLDREAKRANIAQSYASIRASNLSAQNAQFGRLIDLAKLGSQEALAQLGIVQDPSNYVSVDTREAQGVQKEVVSNDAYKAVRKGQDSLLAIKAFEDSFKKVGTTSILTPNDNAKLKAEYNAAILNLKEFFNLGVLNGPDEAILRGVLPDPTGTLFNPVAGKATRSGIDSMKGQIEDTLDDRYLSVKSQYSRYNPEQITVLKDLDRIYLQNKSAINPEVDTFIKENPDLTLEEQLQVINTKF